MEKRIACFLAALMMGGMLACPAQAASTFSDVDANATYAEAVNALAEMGIIGGYGDGTYRPDNTLTRTTAAIIICRMMGVEDKAKSVIRSPFPDVPTTHSACGYISKAAEMGIVGGYADGTYKPSNPVTYVQWIKMLVSAWGYTDMANSFGGWPNGYIKAAKELGIIYDEGDIVNMSDFAPRWVVAQLAYNTTMLPINFEGGSVDEKL